MSSDFKPLRRYDWNTGKERSEGEHVMYNAYEEVLEEIDLLAEAGLCQMTTGGKHAYLNDIRQIVKKLGLQGGLTEC